MDENGTVRAAMTDALRTDRAPALALVGALGLAALSAVLVLVATRHGPGTSPDSVQYVASARNLFEGRGFTSAAGDTLTTWPPGLPAVLALGLHLGIEPSTTARVLNAAAMAAIVLLAYVLLRRHVQSAWAVLIGTALVALSPTLLRTADTIWSEPLFCALLLAFVVLAEDLVCDPARGTALLVAAAVVVWASFLVRCVGIALIPAGMVAIYLGRPREGRVRRVVAFAALAALVPALWLIRNVTTGDSFAGTRPSINRTPTEVARTLLLGMGRLVVPDGAPNALTELAGLIVIVAFVGGAVVAWRSGNSARSRWPMTPLVSVVGFSLALLLGSYLFNGTDWSARILAPVYAPLVVIGFALFERARSGARFGARLARHGRRRRLPRVVRARRAVGGRSRLGPRPRRAWLRVTDVDELGARAGCWSRPARSGALHQRSAVRRRGDEPVPGARRARSARRMHRATGPRGLRQLASRSRPARRHRVASRERRDDLPSRVRALSAAADRRCHGQRSTGSFRSKYSSTETALISSSKSFWASAGISFCSLARASASDVK